MDSEVKVLVPGDCWDQLRQLIPSDEDDKKREIWFFEAVVSGTAVVNGTAILKQRELILRARINRNKRKADTTAKLRRWVPMDDTILQAWAALDGFKSEFDAGGDPIEDQASDPKAMGVPAWSLTIEANHSDELMHLSAGASCVDKLFDHHQRLLLEQAWPQLPWEQLKPLGPIASVKWDAQHEMTIEQWTIHQQTLFEVSKRGDATEVEAIAAEIRQHLQALGIQSSGNKEGKTAWALRQLLRSSPA